MIIYKTDEEIRAMGESSRIVARILNELQAMIKPGVPTADLDAHAERRARELGAKPAFKGYRGYPASLCISINEEIIHGIPSPRTLREGDIVSLDFGVLYNGFYGDAARTFAVDPISPPAQKLIRAAEMSEILFPSTILAKPLAKASSAARMSFWAGGEIGPTAKVRAASP